MLKEIPVHTAEVLRQVKNSGLEKLFVIVKFFLLQLEVKLYTLI